MRFDAASCADKGGVGGSFKVLETVDIMWDIHYLDRFFCSDSIRDSIITIATWAVTCSWRHHFMIAPIRQQHPVVSSSLPYFRLFCAFFETSKTWANVVEEGLACSTWGGNINNWIPKPHEREDGAGSVGQRDGNVRRVDEGIYTVDGGGKLWVVSN